MAVLTPPKRKPSDRLGQIEARWGYLFIAAPLLGFLFFAAMPLVISLVFSLTQWDLLRPPQYVGLRNWEEVLALNIAPLPREIDVETGESVFRCGRERVPESRLSEFDGAVDPRNNRPIVCEPRYVSVREVMPERYDEVTQFTLFGSTYLISARDPVMWTSIYNTLFLMLGIPVSLAISLMLAMALNQGIQGKQLFRVIYYMPTILPLAATALIWLWIFNPDFGLLNYGLRQVGLSSLGRTNWLGDVETVKPALIIMGVWGGLGYQMLIFLAGLQGVPRHLYEAAEIDGASRWAKFRNVTWPALTPTTFFLLITSLIGGFQNFVQPYIMTNGGPGLASQTMVMTIWDNGFRDLQMGYASAQAWLLGAIIILITIFNFTMARRWVFYESEGN
jgi:multiple sugar transport system permease protein